MKVERLKQAQRKHGNPRRKWINQNTRCSK